MGATEKWDESAFALINKNGIMRLAWITYMLGRKGNSRLAYTHETYAMMIERIILAKRYVCVWQITTFLFGWWLDIHMICCEPLSLCIQFEWWTNLYEMLVDAKYWIIWYQHNWWIACNWSKHKGKSQQGSVPALCCHLPHILVSSIFFFFVLVQFTCVRVQRECDNLSVILYWFMFCRWRSIFWGDWICDIVNTVITVVLIRTTRPNKHRKCSKCSVFTSNSDIYEILSYSLLNISFRAHFSWFSHSVKRMLNHFKHNASWNLSNLHLLFFCKLRQNVLQQ